MAGQHSGTQVVASAPGCHSPISRWQRATGTLSNANAAIALFRAETKRRGSTMTSVSGISGATHSFAESETIAFTKHVNETFEGDTDCSHLLPIPDESMEPPRPSVVAQ